MAPQAPVSTLWVVRPPPRQGACRKYAHHLGCEPEHVDVHGPGRQHDPLAERFGAGRSWILPANAKDLVGRGLEQLTNAQQGREVRLAEVADIVGVARWPKAKAACDLRVRVAQGASPGTQLAANAIRLLSGSGVVEDGSFNQRRDEGSEEGPASATCVV
ncbi:MAG: hypothetical protein ACRYFY_02030, partial [Janthinobacterium lividum]